MESIAIVLTTLLSVGISSAVIIFYIFQYLRTNHIEIKAKHVALEREMITMRGAVQTMQTQLANIFVIDKPTPNEATEPEKDEVEFREEDPINLPEDVKFEIEGGDTQIPPQYTKN